ncbi:MAG TPA: FAD-dependent oxidoreductase, partial [Candidatus Synoicihabitans sp.]|nr:FAD-dependent oxidoreductase [Candidatus Synoicihabitans sp.]
MTSSSSTVFEPARHVPVWHEADICVLGGSCTGLFAAVRAARLGARVVIIEKQNCFGGVATTSLVNAWHSLHDTEHRRRIIGGLTAEVMQRLERRGAVRTIERNPSFGFIFNSEELKIELDELALAERVR